MEEGNKLEKLERKVEELERKLQEKTSMEETIREMEKRLTVYEGKIRSDKGEVALKKNFVIKNRKAIEHTSAEGRINPETDNSALFYFNNYEKGRLNHIFFGSASAEGLLNTSLLSTNLVIKDDIKKISEEIWKLADEEFNINSTKQLKEILFEKIKISSIGIKKTKTGFSTAFDELEKIKHLHPIIHFIQEYRELSKLSSTYVEALPQLVSKRDERIHTSFNQTITATGRLSSSEPNLQNIPTKTELGNKIRQAFVAPAGKKLLSLDYSQIELRVMAHLSEDKQLLMAFQRGLDIHTATAASIFSRPPEEVDKKLRSQAKAVNFGILYGQGPHGLSQSAGISYQEAREFIKKYFESYRGVKKYIDDTIKLAEEKGYTETMFGRKRSLPEINSTEIMKKKSAERMAINSPIQGSAADIIKIAMIKVSEEIKGKKDIKMLLQVHDELIFEVDEKEIESYYQKIKKIMEEVGELQVPLVVEGYSGDNWGDIKKINL